MRDGLIQTFESRYEEYLGDESKMKGYANSISFPKTKEDVALILGRMAESLIPVTVQGGRTGICGGAVPLGGHILNLSGMNKILGLSQKEDTYLVRVQAGLMLSELENQLVRRSFDTSGWDEGSLNALKTFRGDYTFFWPIEPTETSATVGGILATNAQGICVVLYGDSRQFVEEITLIDGSGEELCILRGEQRVENGCCCLPNGKVLTVDTSALMFAKGLDVIDLFLGSEGLYGVIVEATLRLVQRPKEMWGIGFFFEEQESLFQFTEQLVTIIMDKGTAAIAAIEYLDRITLDHVQQLKKVASKLKGLPDVDEKYIGMIYLELHGEKEIDIETIAQELMELASACNCTEDSTWALSGLDDIEKLRVFRHAAPESINIELEKAHQQDARITKLSTDLIFRTMSFRETVEFYQKEANDRGLKIAIFGHVADNHVHVNILPNDYAQYQTGRELVKAWAEKAARENGMVFCEHGVGKIKKELFDLTANAATRKNLHSIKKVLDPQYVLNCGNVMERDDEKED